MHCLLPLFVILSMGSQLLVLAGEPAVVHKLPSVPSGSGSKRQLLTCEESFGAGSVTCGNATSPLCYTPSEGEVCCPGSGACMMGQVCAPVAGYCCAVGESIASCAASAGFAIPSSTAAPTRPPTPGSTGVLVLGGGNMTGNRTYIVVSNAMREQQEIVAWAVAAIAGVAFVMANL